MISNKNKLEKVSQWYKSTEGVNAYMILCVYKNFKKHLKEPILEVGPSDGYMTHLLTEKNKIKDIELVEASSNYIKKLNKKFPKTKIFNCKIESFKTRKKYNTIIVSHVLEHVKNPQSVLKKISSLLTNNGNILISVPNANSMHRLIGVQMGLLKDVHDLNLNDKKIGHYRVYDQNSLTTDIKKSNLNIVRMTGSFMKYLSNSQIEDYINPKQWKNYYDLGKHFPDNCADLCVICKK